MVSSALSSRTGQPTDRSTTHGHMYIRLLIYRCPWTISPAATVVHPNGRLFAPPMTYRPPAALLKAGCQCCTCACDAATILRCYVEKQTVILLRFLSQHRVASKLDYHISVSYSLTIARQVVEIKHRFSVTLHKQN